MLSDVVKTVKCRGHIGKIELVGKDPSTGGYNLQLSIDDNTSIIFRNVSPDEVEPECFEEMEVVEERYNKQIEEVAVRILGDNDKDYLTAILKRYDEAVKDLHPDNKWRADCPFWAVTSIF